MKVLNLYAGIGGNRKLWEDVDVTAVEIDASIADVYSDYFPEDEVIVDDAHQFLLNNFAEYDFIWSSPPCPTHSRIRKLESGPDGKNDPVYPNMDLYEEVIFLKHYFDGDWVVENVIPFYDPLIEPQKVHRHCFWSNHRIPSIDGLEADEIRRSDENEEWKERTGFDLSEYSLDTRKDKVRHNTMNPKLGKHVFDSITNDSGSVFDL